MHYDEQVLRPHASPIIIIHNRPSSECKYCHYILLFIVFVFRSFFFVLVKNKYKLFGSVRDYNLWRTVGSVTEISFETI